MLHRLSCTLLLLKHMLLPLHPVAQGTNRFGAARKPGQAKWGGGDNTELGTDYVNKLLHLAWHPESNVIAAAASNSLYMYSAT